MLVTVFGGTACAFLVGIFEATLADSLVVVFFLALVLGLGESISTQSLAIAIQALHNTRPTFAWYIRALKREAATAFLLGCSCAAAVAAMVYLWRADAPAAAVIGLSIVLSLVLACCLGLSVPALLHALRLDPKIAAGPVTLALSDMVTLLVYFLLAAMVLSR
jgi:magnesium transporter